MTKSDKAKYLFEKMELIDDKYLDEAINYTPKSGKLIRKISVIIALASVLSVFIVLGIGSLFMKTSKSDSSAKYYADTVFAEASGNHTEFESAKDLVDSVMSDGASHIIWLDTESGKYYDAKISSAQQSGLMSAKKFNKAVSEDYAMGKYKIWIKDSNGEVTSPELKESRGNISYRNVFDYDPELELSDEFVKSLKNILY